jgi:hypothetical protein
MHLEAPPAAVSASLAILDRAAVVRRGRRGENRAKVTVKPPPESLFGAPQVPPGLSRLLLWLSKRLGTGREQAVDLEETADLLGRSERGGPPALHGSAHRVRAAVPRSRHEIRARASWRTSSATSTSICSRAQRAREERSTRSSATRGCRARRLLEAPAIRRPRVRALRRVRGGGGPPPGSRTGSSSAPPGFGPRGHPRPRRSLRFGGSPAPRREPQRRDEGPARHGPTYALSPQARTSSVAPRRARGGPVSPLIPAKIAPAGPPVALSPGEDALLRGLPAS